IRIIPFCAIKLRPLSAHESAAPISASPIPQHPRPESGPTLSWRLLSLYPRGGKELIIYFFYFFDFFFRWDLFICLSYFCVFFFGSFFVPRTPPELVRGLCPPAASRRPTLLTRAITPVRISVVPCLRLISRHRSAVRPWRCSRHLFLS